MVIQRWQSVLLAIACVMMALFSFLSLGQVQLTDATLNFTALGFCVEGEQANGASNVCYLSTVHFFIISLLSAIIPLISIFLFKNIKLQMKTCLFEILFIVVVIVIAGYEGYYAIPEGSVSWSSIIVAPFIALIATVMAYSRISADYRTLRSVDRIR